MKLAHSIASRFGLVILAASSALAIAVYALPKNARKHARLCLKIFLGIGAIGLAIFSSFDSTEIKIATASDLLKLLTPSLVFFLNVTLRLLIIMWAVAIAAGLFRPDRITELSAKVFGIELNHKFTKDEILERQQDAERIDNQVRQLAGLNEAILEYISGPFEEDIIAAPDKAEEVRRRVRQVLTDAYYPLKDKVRLYVLPDTTDARGSLPKTLRDLVDLVYDSEADSLELKHDHIGIAVHHGTQGLGTVIIIESTSDYELCLAEVIAASILFVSVSAVMSEDD